MPATTRGRKRAQGENTMNQVSTTLASKRYKNPLRAIPTRNTGIATRSEENQRLGDDAVLLAIKTKQHKALCRLLKRPDCNLDGAWQFAAVNGFHHVVSFLLPKILTNEEYNLPDNVSDSLREAAVAAASKVHLEVVRLLLRELQSEQTDEHYGEFVFYGYEDIYPENQNGAAWAGLNAAAANGHLEVVELAAGYAEERDRVAAGERSTALKDATAAGYTEIVQFLEDCDDFNTETSGPMPTNVSTCEVTQSQAIM
ncbi:hypothetical protein PHYPSEUDO_013297 [Phytophthora pseudosyringae]|uniref:Uncharacterized protein n=1 Tax=Phytophthora pseudosyringae TaxID=221518 RepID=A0A8T1V8U2_9STRA|nr:hypothetical protein PHYPSEUDO_013297 [Phytophthora pseudosyringae]